jgi:hypothetical protein
VVWNGSEAVMAGNLTPEVEARSRPL